MNNRDKDKRKRYETSTGYSSPAPTYTFTDYSAPYDSGSSYSCDTSSYSSDSGCGF
ncbi:hypothetical protein [Nocardia yunnanensis]|uniref:hypothetical protein n=1 Tax=Nocardia yunnanensis TaxID=2382165 RepID=UPI0013C4C98D|nr:hypothetical protein [Nocardia yunnanensis]